MTNLQPNLREKFTNWIAEFTLSPGIESSDEPLRLDQFLKMRGITGTGGQAKLLIQGGEVRVNGTVETRRRRQLRTGDVVEFEGCQYPVVLPDAK